MRKTILMLLSLVMLQSVSSAIEKTKVDGNIPESVGKAQKINGDSIDQPLVGPTKHGATVSTPAKKTFDEFIDKDGDGIDDRIAAKAQKTPAKEKSKQDETKAKPKPRPRR